MMGDDQWNATYFNVNGNLGFAQYDADDFFRQLEAPPAENRAGHDDAPTCNRCNGDYWQDSQHYGQQLAATAETTGADQPISSIESQDGSSTVVGESPAESLAEAIERIKTAMTEQNERFQSCCSAMTSLVEQQNAILVDIQRQLAAVVQARQSSEERFGVKVAAYSDMIDDKADRLKKWYDEATAADQA